MGKIVARNASLGVDDSANTCRALTGTINNVTLSWTAEAPEVTAFGDNTRQRLPDGLKDVELTIEAFYDSAANQIDAVLAGILGGSTRWAFGPTGSTSGCVMYSTCAVCTNCEFTFGVADSATMSATFTNRSGSLTRTTWA